MTRRGVALALAGVDASLAVELSTHIRASRRLLRQADLDISPAVAEFLAVLDDHIRECRNVWHPAPFPTGPSDDGHVGNLLQNQDTTLTVAQLAAVLRVDRATVYRMWRRGQGPSWIGPPGRRRVRVEDAVEYMSGKVA